MHLAHAGMAISLHVSNAEIKKRLKSTSAWRSMKSGAEHARERSLPAILTGAGGGVMDCSRSARSATSIVSRRRITKSHYPKRHALIAD
jgi:hypothetical protein